MTNEIFLYIVFLPATLYLIDVTNKPVCTHKLVLSSCEQIEKINYVNLLKKHPEIDPQSRYIIWTSIEVPMKLGHVR